MEFETTKKRNYKLCFVPLCRSTTISTPNKYFVSVPRRPERRKAWIRAVRRDERGKKLSLTSSLFCCEDHFNMQEDMENFLRFRMVGGHLQVKSEVVPHIFNCQPQRSTSRSVTRPRLTTLKRNATRFVSAILDADMQNSTMEENVQCSGPEPTIDLPTDEIEIAQQPSTSFAGQQLLQNETTVTTASLLGHKRDVGIQARVNYRSKSTMSTPVLIGSVTNNMTQTSPIKTSTCDAQVSPIKLLNQSRLFVESVFTDSCTIDNIDSECDLGPSSSDRPTSGGCYYNSSGDSSMESEFEADRFQGVSLERIRYLSKQNSMLYLGLPTDSLFILDILANKINYRSNWLCSKDIAMLVFRKIRLNESFDIIANEFGISKSHANRLFKNYVHVIADYLKDLIVWPSKESILRLLPISFQARYSNVQSIIDCFEIEIEKPSSAVNQALTWSDYKKCNTLKYLVSATPDGVINFISEGYGGRVSDMILLENCGYLEKLPEGTEVMADRGFKHVEKAIQKNKCKLVRPPSVSDGSKLTAADCKETKRIASLRIHIERLIRRIREFKLLTPHACIDIHLVGEIDCCVYIVAGLINLQASLIK